jgi:hypothetical protein
MRLMSETSETPTVRSSTATAPVPASTDPAPYIHKTPKVFLLAAWVAIVAGIVFIVAVIFFAGFGLGRHAGHGGFHHHHHHHHGMMMHPHGPGGPGGPGGGGPAATPQGAPSSLHPSAGPGQIPSSVLPSVTTSP